jgi:hypothetical protein
MDQIFESEPVEMRLIDHASVKMGGEEEKWKGQRILRRSVGD